MRRMPRVVPQFIRLRRVRDGVLDWRFTGQVVDQDKSLYFIFIFQSEWRRSASSSTFTKHYLYSVTPLMQATSQALRVPTYSIYSKFQYCQRRHHHTQGLLEGHFVLVFPGRGIVCVVKDRHHILH